MCQSSLPSNSALWIDVRTCGECLSIPMACKHTKAVYFCRVHCTYILYSTYMRTVHTVLTYYIQWYILYSIIYSMLYTYICSTYIVYSVNITGSGDFSVCVIHIIELLWTPAGMEILGLVRCYRLLPSLGCLPTLDVMVSRRSA